MRITVQLPDDLLVQAERRASSEGMSLNALIEEGLRRLVNECVATADHRERKTPRISSASGGLKAGIEASKINTQTEQIDDIERLRRLALSR